MISGKHGRCCQAISDLAVAIDTFEATIPPFPDKTALGAAIDLGYLLYSIDREGPYPWELQAGAKATLLKRPSANRPVA